MCGLQMDGGVKIWGSRWGVLIAHVADEYLASETRLVIGSRISPGEQDVIDKYFGA